MAPGILSVQQPPPQQENSDWLLCPGYEDFDSSSSVFQTWNVYFCISGGWKKCFLKWHWITIHFKGRKVFLFRLLSRDSAHNSPSVWNPLPLKVMNSMTTQSKVASYSLSPILPFCVTKTVCSDQTLIRLFWVLCPSRPELGHSSVFVKSHLSKNPAKSMQWKLPTLIIWLLSIVITLAYLQQESCWVSLARTPLPWCFFSVIFHLVTPICFLDINPHLSLFKLESSPCCLP